MTAILTLAEVQALPDTGPWHVAACHSHVPGGQHYRPGEPAPTCVAVRDEAGRPVERPRSVLDLQAAAPALRATVLALYTEVERLRTEASNAFGEQMRAEGERDAARRELAEVRFALGAIADGLSLGKAAGDLALFAAQAAESLMSVTAERDRLRVEWCHVVDERDRMRAANASLTGDNCRACWCCVPDYPLMMLCPDCGNKRCPHATNHRFRCTGSDALGQVGTLAENT